MQRLTVENEIDSRRQQRANPVRATQRDRVRTENGHSSTATATAAGTAAGQSQRWQKELHALVHAFERRVNGGVLATPQLGGEEEGG